MKKSLRLFLLSSWLSLGLHTVLVATVAPLPLSSARCRISNSLGPAQVDTVAANLFFTKGQQLLANAKYDSALGYLQTAAGEFAGQAMWRRVVHCRYLLADGWYRKENMDSSLAQIDKAFVLLAAHVPDGKLETAACHIVLGNIRRYQANFTAAINAYETALQLRRQVFGEAGNLVASSLSSLGVINNDLKDYDRSLSYFRRARLILEKLDKTGLALANCYLNMSLPCTEKGYFQQAIDYLEKAEKIYAVRLPVTHPTLASLQINLGRNYGNLGDYDLYWISMNKAMAIVEKSVGENSSLGALVLAHLGRAAENFGDYNRALSFSNRALAVFRARLGESHPEVAKQYMNSALLLYKLERYSHALNELDHGLTVLQSAHAENHPYRLLYDKQMALVYAAQKDSAQALDYMRRGQNLLNGLPKTQEVDRIDYDQFCGSLHAILGLNEKALQYYNSALARVRSWSSRHDSLRARDSFVLFENFKYMFARADLEYNIYAADSTRRDFLSAAATDYQAAIRLFDELQNAAYAEPTKLLLTEVKAGSFARACETFAELYRLQGDPYYLDQSFQFAEHGHGKVLLKAVFEARAKQFTGIEDSLLQKEERLRADVNYYERKISTATGNQTTNDSLAVQYAARFQEAVMRHRNLLEEMKTVSPQYYRLKYADQSATIENVQSRLTPKTMFLEYVLGEKDLLIYAIDSKTCTLNKVAVDSLFFVAVDHLTGLLQNRTLDMKNNRIVFAETSQQLYRRLIAPVEHRLKGKNHIVLVPDGVLNNIPFETLIVPQSSTDNLGEMDYLIRRFALSYHYSASLWLDRFQRPRRNLQDQWIAFAPVFDQHHDNGRIPAANHALKDTFFTQQAFRAVDSQASRFAYLPGAENEVRQIAKLFQQQGKAVSTFLFEQATETQFAACGRSRFLHVATHGFFNEAHPKYSGLAFTQPQDSMQTDDGILYAGEVYDLDLSNDLVVLSSCEGGGGKIVRGEGCMALTRGFLYTGIPNILFSLWKISDQSTGKLMLEFYRHVLSGQTYAESLRHAKLKMLRSEITSLPAYWSPFLLIGH